MNRHSEPSDTQERVGTPYRGWMIFEAGDDVWLQAPDGDVLRDPEITCLNEAQRTIDHIEGAS